jgi:hypothetical protein
MNDTDSNAVADLKKQFSQLLLALKIGLFALLLGACYCAIRASFSIPQFAVIYHEILGPGKPLPADTQFAIAAQQWLMALACALPAVGLVPVFAGWKVQPVIVLVVCLAIATAEYFFIWWAMAWPLINIIKAMSNGAGSQ